MASGYDITIKPHQHTYVIEKITHAVNAINVLNVFTVLLKGNVANTKIFFCDIRLCIESIKCILSMRTNLDFHLRTVSKNEYRQRK